MMGVSAILCVAVAAALSVLYVPTPAHSYQTQLGDDLFVLVQTTVRNQDGALAVYLESTKFTHLDLGALGSFLDYEASLGDDPVVSLEGDPFQIIRRVQESTVTEGDVFASTNLHSSVGDGPPIHLARFAHDGYAVSPGDTLQSIWTFVRRA